MNWTSVFERQAKAAGLGFDDIFDIAATIAMDPLAGDLIVGSGGARKIRHAGRGKGKSGVGAHRQGSKSEPEQSEVNDLAKLLSVLAENYRKGARP